LKVLLFGGEVLHGVQEQGPRFDCWISVHTLKRASKEGWGWGRWGEEEECGPTLSVAISSLFFLGEQLTKFGTIEKAFVSV